MNSGNGLCGYHDWRLPNRKELLSLIDYSINAPALPTGHLFANLQSGGYWSSTTYAYDTGYAWGIGVWVGVVFSSDKGVNDYVWPVRGESTQFGETGQKKCYNSSGAEINCSVTGQDGDIQAGVAWPNPRFTMSGDCVTDNLTGLMWAKNANLAGTKTWQSALDYIASMNSGAGLCGYHTWRLPNVNELESLVNAEQANAATWLNGQGFTNVQSDYYWSSTTFAYVTGSAWYVDIWGGHVGSDDKSVDFYVWPVRAGQLPPGDITLNVSQSGSGTVTSNTYMHHFYTISEADNNYVIATWPDVWTYEGPVYYAFTPQ